MTTEVDQITALLESAGWNHTDTPPSASDALDAIYVSDYAAIGLAVKNSAEDVVASWSDCQRQLATAKAGEARAKDLYLLFLVPEVDLQRAAGLQTVVSDTHVARKLCIERRNRPLRDVLMDTFFIPAATANLSTKQPMPFVSGALDLSLLDDLTKKSAGAVLDRAIAGEYRSSEASHET